MSEYQRDQIDDTTQVVGLLDRAATHAPQLHVGHDEVVARGRRIRRGRRRTAAGVGALALAGTLWLGMETLPLGGEAPPVPASVGWSDGSIDTQLFDNAPNPEHEPDRTHWSARLRTVEGGRHPELVLTEDGGEPRTIVGEDGPGESEVFRAEGITVLVWAAPEDGLGEDVLWTGGVKWGQGGEVDVPGGAIRYATAESVPGVEPDARELYLIDRDGVTAASGAPVESALLETDDMRWVVGVDLARDSVTGTWWDESGRGGTGGVLDLTDGAAYAGGLGGVPSHVLGVLPEGAAGVTVRPADARSDVVTAAGQQVVLATADEGAGLPTVSFTIDGEEHELSSFVESAKSTIMLGDLSLVYRATPDALDLERGPDRVALTQDELTDTMITVVPIDDRVVVVVPGWAPADVDAPVQVAVTDAAVDDETPRWVEAEGVQVRELFDLRPVTFLVLDAPEDGEEVVGIGEAVSDGTVSQLDQRQVQVRPLGD